MPLTSVHFYPKMPTLAHRRLILLKRADGAASWDVPQQMAQGLQRLNKRSVLPWCFEHYSEEEAKGSAADNAARRRRRTPVVRSSRVRRLPVIWFSSQHRGAQAENGPDKFTIEA